MRIGIDLGGTKIEGLLLDEGGTERARERTATPRDDYAATVRAVADLVARLEGVGGATATVGLGMPGTVSRRSGVVKNANLTWLNGRTLDRDLAAALDRPVRWANDANCLALSEAVDGAGAGAEVVFGVILGTGVGGGLVVGGRLLPGANGVTGEWGHNPLPWPRPDELEGPPCYCGQRGCIETWLSGPSLARDHRSATGEDLAAPAVVAAAAAGDGGAEATLRRYAERLSRALAHVVNIVDPDVIVLGGGLSNVERLYRGANLASWVFGGEASTPIRRARHGDSSGVRGAAWLWPPATPLA